jgi:hypothetical protein
MNYLNSVDYPKPIVKHEEVSKENMSKMKLAYDAHKAAASPSVEHNGGVSSGLMFLPKIGYT